VVLITFKQGVAFEIEVIQVGGTSANVVVQNNLVIFVKEVRNKAPPRRLVATEAMA
jgi:hypothetical protein